MTTSTIDLLPGWRRLWNGELGLAPSLVTDEFGIHFGRVSNGAAADDLRGPDDLASFIGAFRAPRPGLEYSAVAELAAPGHAVSVWNAVDPATGLRVGGLDVFLLADDGRARKAWSVTAERPMG